MTKRPWFLIAPVLLLLPLSAGLVGGWAVVTVEQLPEYAVAGEPVTLRFMVRQHGVDPLKNLRPTIDARAGGNPAASVAARPGKTAGQYVATFTPPEPGDWTLTIHSGFGNSKLTLLPIPAIRQGAPAPAALADSERGKRLFVAKGCVGCHLRSEAGLAIGEKIGPELTGKRYQAEFLRRFLADPAANPTRTGTFRMPNLLLQPAEIGALVAFINSERTASR